MCLFGHDFGYFSGAVTLWPYAFPRSIRMPHLPSGMHVGVDRGTGKEPPKTTPAGLPSVGPAAPHPPHPHRPPHKSRGLSSRPQGLTCSGRAWYRPATCSWPDGHTPVSGLVHPGTVLVGCHCGRTIPRSTGTANVAGPPPPSAPCPQELIPGGGSVAVRRPQRKHSGVCCHPCWRTV